MIVPIAALLFGTLTTVGFASPTPVSEKKTCTTVYPSSLQVIKSTDPNKSFDNTAPANTLTIQQDQTNANEPARTLQYIDFEVPHGPGVWGCQLHVTDQNKVMTWTNSTSGQKAPAVNVIALEPNSVGDVTYNKIINADPSIISARYFGYFALYPGNHSTINAEGCPALTSDGKNGHLGFVFEFEYASWKGNMEWSLPQKVPGVDGVAEGDNNGVYMSYGECWT